MRIRSAAGALPKQIADGEPDQSGHSAEQDDPPDGGEVRLLDACDGDQEVQKAGQRDEESLLRRFALSAVPDSRDEEEEGQKDAGEEKGRQPGGEGIQIGAVDPSDREDDEEPGDQDDRDGPVGLELVHGDASFR